MIFENAYRFFSPSIPYLFAISHFIVPSVLDRIYSLGDGVFAKYVFSFLSGGVS